MEHRQLGDSGIEVSTVALGSWLTYGGGVSQEQMAYAALFTALTDLVSLYGEDAVKKLVQGLERRVDIGEFTLDRKVQ